MSRPTALRNVLAAALFASAAALGACGKTGALQRPAPLFGHARTTKAPPGDESRQGQDPSRPISTIDERDPSRDSPEPARTEPIAGQGPDPTAVGPPGVLPDPYANPGR
jgi:hypothetical protein